MTRRMGPSAWTPEITQRYWDHRSTAVHRQEEYFSFQVGDGLVSLLAAAGKLEGTALDLGCGPGYLLEHLLAAGLRCAGVDSSPATVARVNDRFRGRAGWMGCQRAEARIPADDRAFDVVTCVEVVEHLTEGGLTGLLDEVRRVLRPGGLAVFTTPHEEDLRTGMIYCPFCEAEFHRVQHLRSFTVEALSSLLGAHGYTVAFCAPVNLRVFQERLPGWKDWSPRALKRAAARGWMRARDMLNPRPFAEGRLLRGLAAGGGPHLVALATSDPVHPR